MAEVKVHLKRVRLSFPNLFVAKAFKDNPKPKFDAAFLIPKKDPQVLEIQKAMVAVATDKWGAKAAQILGMLERDDKLCMHDGDRKDYDGYAGNYFIRASNEVQPTLLTADRIKLTQDNGLIYSGCYVNAIISIYAQDNGFGKRINANLGGVQFASDGQAFKGGRPASVDEFEAVPTNQAESALGSLGF